MISLGRNNRITSLLDTTPCPALPSIAIIAANANYHRRKNRPQHTQNLNFKQNNPWTNTRQLSTPWCPHWMGATSCLCKGHPSNLLDQDLVHRRDISCHPTSILPAIFNNRISSTRSDTKQLPIEICVMPRRRKADYVAVYQELFVILPQWQVKRIVLDLEDATWRAVWIIFPTVQLKGCAFHFTQAMWRHIRARLALGLKFV